VSLVDADRALCAANMGGVEDIRRHRGDLARVAAGKNAGRNAAICWGGQGWGCDLAVVSGYKRGAGGGVKTRQVQLGQVCCHEC
jgi:hypothetical protein